MEKTCESLLQELQVIWDEVGESQDDRKNMLIELEQDCLNVYKEKIEKAKHSRAWLQQRITDSKAELTAIFFVLDEPLENQKQCNQNTFSLKEEHKEITSLLEEMRKMKADRLNQFIDVIEQIRRVSMEIRPLESNSSTTTIDESDLSLRILEELQHRLNLLQIEKIDRLNSVSNHLSTLNSICSVLGIDSKQIVYEIHPSLAETEGSRSVTDDTIERLVSTMQSLREIKIQRMQKLQDLASTMLELWHLMDTPLEEQHGFQNVTCNIAASECEITEPNTLSMNFIDSVAAEVSRLEVVKTSKMKEIIIRKKIELEELCRRIHLVEESDCAIEMMSEYIETGAVDPSLVLEQIESRISNVKDDAFSRKEVLERIEKWMAACEEESWLEEYNRDENRYSAGKGVHVALRRAEKARVTVSKIPAMVEALTAKITMWEKEMEKEFTYDGANFLLVLENYTTARQEKEQERKKQRDQRRLQGQLIAEQEVLFGSKTSPSKPQSPKKGAKASSAGIAGKRSLLSGVVSQPSKLTNLVNSTKPACSNRKGDGDEEAEISTPGRKALDAITTLRKPFIPLISENNCPSTPSKLIDTEMQLVAIGAEPDSQIAQVAAAEMPGETEFSFEERRAGFLLPNAHVKYVQT